MSAYNYSRFASDFSERTEVINNSYDGDYKVTSLINSMLGMVIVPFGGLKLFVSNGMNKRDVNNKIKASRYYSDILTLLKKMRAQGRLYGDDIFRNKEIEMYNFLRHLRNSVAHLSTDRSGISFIPIAAGKEITDIYFSDYWNNRENSQAEMNFCMKISVRDLEELLHYLAGIYKDVYFDVDTRDLYNDKIKSCREYLESKTDRYNKNRSY